MLRPWVFALLACLAAPIEAVEPVALVTELAGAGTYGVEPQASALELLQDLAPGARLTLARGARAVVVHTASGVVYELFGPGSFRVQATAVQASDGKARINRRELPPEIRAYKLNPARAAQASIVLRSGSDFHLDGPDGGVLSEDELRYSVSGNLTETRLDVLDEQGSHVLHVDGPDGVFPLKGRHVWVAGHRYRVQVSGTDARGRPALLQAAFLLLPPDAMVRLRSRQPVDATATTDWIVYALALESSGANATARTIWRSLYAAR
jgi:hypothetical protein